MKLEDFTSEMLDEIKSAKDLVKGEIPALAKEYINMQMIMSKLGMGLGGLIITVGVCLGLVATFHTFHGEDAHDSFQACCLLGGIGSMVGVILTLCNLSTYIEYKMQPRRMAIKAITSLKM